MINLIILDNFRKVGLVIGWLVLIALAYKVSKIQMDHVEYDPYAELGVDRVRLNPSDECCSVDFICTLGFNFTLLTFGELKFR